MHALFDTWRWMFVAGMTCLFGGQLLWFVAGGTYNALCCLARGQSPLAWLREISFVHLHALLPPVAFKGRVSPRLLQARYPYARWWYTAATFGMATEMLGLLLTLLSLGFELLARLGQPAPLFLHF